LRKTSIYHRDERVKKAILLPQTGYYKLQRKGSRNKIEEMSEVGGVRSANEIPEKIGRREGWDHAFTAWWRGRGGGCQGKGKNENITVGNGNRQIVHCQVNRTTGAGEKREKYKKIISTK